MFETCMVESAGQLKSHNRKWATASAFLIEGALLTVGVLAAVVHTEAINLGPKVVHIVPSFSMPLARTEIATGVGGGGGQAFVQPLQIPTSIATGGTTHWIGTDTRDQPPCQDCIGDLPGIGPVGQLPFVSVPTPAVHPQRLRLSRVDPAQLVRQVKPAYPRLAVPLHLSSAQVLLHAIIAKNGTMQNLEVVTGHPLFNQAALDAVRQWIYRPTYLGGEPVEVETTITVNFTMGQ